MWDGANTTSQPVSLGSELGCGAVSELLHLDLCGGAVVLLSEQADC